MQRVKLIRQVQLDRQGRPYTVIRVVPRAARPGQWIDLAILIAVIAAGIWMLAS